MPNDAFHGIKRLLVTTAMLEMGIGLALVVLPSQLVTVLLGSSLGTAVSVTVAGVAGVALFALGLACWLARHDGASGAARGLVGAMLLDNVAVAMVLVYGATVLELTSLALWPTALLHVAMGSWCLMQLLDRPARVS